MKTQPTNLDILGPKIQISLNSLGPVAPENGWFEDFLVSFWG